MAKLGFNPFMLGGQSFGGAFSGKKNLPQYPQIPPPWMQPAQGPEIQGRDPPPQWGPHEGPHAPPGAPAPGLLPKPPVPPMSGGPVGGMPPSGPETMGGPPSMGGPPQRLGVPGAPPVDPGLSDPAMGSPWSKLQEAEKMGLMGLGNMPEEMSAMNDQIKQAEALRMGTSPEGRDSGRVYTASSPLEHIGSLMTAHANKRKLEGGKEALGGIIKAQPGLYNQRQEQLNNATALRKRLADLMFNKE